MITPSFGLTATERVLPRLALDFTTATLDPRVTFTRSGNTATVTDSSGVIVGINADLPRFDYDPLTLTCKGLLIEESRTNVLLNSLIDGTSLATQTVTVTAAVRTLSFYGTGEIVLSGAASATVTGTGAYPTRTVFTFTPSAGSLTLTVTGTVQFAQLEAGAFATSYIPTAGSQVTRSADIATMTGANFSDWFNASEGSFQGKFIKNGASNFQSVLVASDNTTNNQIVIGHGSGAPNNNLRFDVSVLNSSQASITTVSPSLVGVPYNAVGAYKQNSFAASTNASTPGTDVSGSIPAVSRLSIGCNASASTNFLNGTIAEINYWPQRLINSEVRAFSK
jgi:hypothetical protein